MIKYYKNSIFKTPESVKRSLQAMNDFINPEIDSAGVSPPNLDLKLMKIWNNGDNLPYDFINKTESEEKNEGAELSENKKLKTDLQYFIDVKVKPLRNQKLYEWIDETFMKQLLFNLTTSQKTERKACRTKLLDFPESVTEYATDKELNDLINGLKPSYITEPV